jgi:tRNA uridine 5-carbamoylmethylation protein Kti12
VSAGARLVLLCGLPGSCKTTLAKRDEPAAAPPTRELIEQLIKVEQHLSVATTAATCCSDRSITASSTPP